MLRKYVRQLRPLQENKISYINKVQQLIAEELSPSEELQEAIKLVERIDSKISGINLLPFNKLSNALLRTVGSSDVFDCFFFKDTPK